MKRYVYGFLALVMSCLFAAGCASKAAYTPIDLNPLIKSGQVVQKTDNFVVLLDRSSSMDGWAGKASRIAYAKDVTNRMIATIPDLKLTAGLRTFWDEETALVYGMTSFNKQDFLKAIDNVGRPNGRTPMGRTIVAAGEDLKGAAGKSAIIIVSDFEEIEGIDDIRPKSVMEAIGKVKTQYGDGVCVYTVQVGTVPIGKMLSEEMVRESRCGRAVNADDLATPEAMAGFVREIFLGAPPAQAMEAEKTKPAPAQAPAEVEKAAVAPAAAAAAAAFEDIHFDFDKYDLKPEARDLLSKLGEFMQANKEATVLIEGNCDERGTIEYNLALGDRRALSAKKYLVNLGVDQGRIKTISYGKERPLDPGHNEEAWAKNRRDHFIVTEK